MRLLQFSLILCLIIFASGCVVLLPFIEQDGKGQKNAKADPTAEERQTSGVRSRGNRPDPLKKLVAQLQNGDSAARTRAATGLGDQGRRARSALPQLIAALDDESKNVRRAAVKALEKVGGVEIEEPLILKLRDRDRYVRESAANVLRRLGSPRARKALKDLKV